MAKLKEDMLNALKDLDTDEFHTFKWWLRQPGNVEGLQPLTKSDLEKANMTDTIDRIVEHYPNKENQIMVNVLKKINRFDLVGRFENTPKESPGNSTNREDYLKHSYQLSLDPNTVASNLYVSEENRKVTYQPCNLQDHPDHPDRFSLSNQVLSRESLSEQTYIPFYFEVEWNGGVRIAVSYKDIHRKKEHAQKFGENDKSWSLMCSGGRYWLQHNRIGTEVFGPRPSEMGRWYVGVMGVYVDHKAGRVSFFSVDVYNNTMILLHNVRTTFTQPLYAGIWLFDRGCTAEVCKIW